MQECICTKLLGTLKVSIVLFIAFSLHTLFYSYTIKVLKIKCKNQMKILVTMSINTAH